MRNDPLPPQYLTVSGLVVSYALYAGVGYLLAGGIARRAGPPCSPPCGPDGVWFVVIAQPDAGEGCPATAMVETDTLERSRDYVTVIPLTPQTLSSYVSAIACLPGHRCPRCSWKTPAWGSASDPW